MTSIKATCYVSLTGDLLHSDTAKYLRKATAAEKRESFAAGETGHFTADVSERTLKRAGVSL